VNSWLVRILAVAVLLMMVAPAALAADSAALYKTKCAVCHSADGSGDSAMGKKTGAHDFRSPEVQKMTEAQLTEITVKGKNKMPGYDKKLTADEIKGLVAYVRELGKKK
jgi:mono/diheme cytochrome c family protein